MGCLLNSVQAIAAKVTIQWQNCPSDIKHPQKATAFQCAWLSVPKDHNQVSKGYLSILVGMHSAKNNQQKVGTLLINSGGPWGADVQNYLADFLDKAPASLLASFDIIAINYRGTYNNPISCQSRSPSVSIDELDKAIFNFPLKLSNLSAFYDLAAYRNSLSTYPPLAN